VHPLLSDRRRLLAYGTLAVPVGASLLGLLALHGGFRPWPAALLALPQTLVVLALLIPVWYVCRSLPIGQTTLSRLLGTHGAAAAVTSVVWVYLGAALTRALSNVLEEELLPLYRAQFPALLATGGVLYLLAASLHYVLLAEDATQRATQQTMELRILAREAELRALKAQVHPHFLFNSLNSISSLTTSDPARAREMCILLSEFFRQSLAMGNKPAVALEEELALARTYLAIEAMRLGPRLTVAEEIDLGGAACPVPPLLLQPLVENAIRHGIATCTEGGVLRIEARAQNGRLRLAVSNPYDPDAPTRPGVGLGLGNVRQRLAARYGEHASMDAQRREGEFKVTLVVPVEAS
jgi:sensor histidine kinase YesM